jgi:hypothetical protein
LKQFSNRLAGPRVSAVRQPGRLGPALARSFLMAAQPSQDMTPPPKWAVKVKRLLAECEHLPRALHLATWAAYAYAAQAAAGFAIGLALPWLRLLTQ